MIMIRTYLYILLASLLLSACVSINMQNGRENAADNDEEHMHKSGKIEIPIH